MGSKSQLFSVDNSPSIHTALVLDSRPRAVPHQNKAHLPAAALSAASWEGSHKLIQTLTAHQAMSNSSCPPDRIGYRHLMCFS